MPRPDRSSRAPRSRRSSGSRPQPEPDLLRPGAVALVTGAGTGIGRATALALAGTGTLVLCADIDAVAAKATAAHCRGHAYEVDVADREAMEAVAEAVHAEHGPLDVLVNNAGVGMSARFLDTSPDDWRWILDININGVLHGCQVFGPAMVERGRGQVVNLSSGLGFFPRATEPAYCTTKAAVLMLSQCLRADWAESGVGVSAVCPGIINTGIISRTRFRGERADARSVADVQRTFARGHKPEQVADAIVAGIRTNKAIVPVGIEARFARWSQRFLPGRLQERLAGTQMGRV